MCKHQKIYFISDLHLDESHPKAIAQFLRLLNQCDASIDALYILGDLFEVWIGDDDNSTFYQAVISALKNVTQKGLPVYLLYGNRDFLIGKHFLHQTGCQLLPDEAKINIYNTPVLLMHGDTLCTNDVVYLQLRKKIRHPLLQKFFLLLPLKLRRQIANKMRAKSRHHTQTISLDVMDVVQEEVESKMKKHAVNLLIHGHTHRPGIHQFTMHDASASRIVLDAWHDRGNVFVWNETGEKELVWFE